MGYQQGLSGLSAASSDLDVIGNNISNSSTMGFKGSSAIFADVYASSVATAVGNQVGLGTQMVETQQNFSQGGLTQTGQALDVAINGSGFFQLASNGGTVYSRNGVFQLNKDGELVSTSGLPVMGYAADATGKIDTSKSVTLTIPTGNSAPAPTKTITGKFNLNAQDSLMLGTPAVAVTTTGSLTSSGATITDATLGSNADSYTISFTSPTTYTVTDAANPSNNSSGTFTAGQPITLGGGQQITLGGTAASGDSVTVSPTPVAFNKSNPSTYNYSTSVQVYDSLGGAQTVNMYFAKTGANSWDVYAGTANGSVQQVGTASFTTSGELQGVQQLISAGPPATFGAPTTANTLSLSIPNADGSATPQPISLDLTGTTQYGGSDGTNSLAQDGYAAGTMTNFAIGSDGVVTGSYSNGQTKALGQIAIATFANQNGLVNLGNNQFQQSAQSGIAQVSAPGSSGHGSLQGGALEESNVDMTNQLVSLITAQRFYQANAQTIKTQQTVDQTLMNL